MSKQDMSLHIQYQILVLKAVKREMLCMARTVTRDQTTLKDLEEMIDSMNESFTKNNYENNLDINHIEEYAIMNFSNIANGFEKYSERVIAVMGPLKRTLFCVHVFLARRRVQRVAIVAKKVLV